MEKPCFSSLCLAFQRMDRCESSVCLSPPLSMPIIISQRRAKYICELLFRCAGEVEGVDLVLKGPWDG